jgi:peptidoglycan hydrolase-like protein with peptidoglycan-binding domain
MTADYVVGYDATRTSISSLPEGAQIYAGYSTGSGAIPWSEADFANHATALGPCLRIDQDPAASDPTADILDVERGAATTADCAWWAKRALADFRTARRPGQRSPAVYMSASAVSSVVNALIAGGVTSGIGLWVANWSIGEAAAITSVLAASGPFPIIGVQWADPGPYDISVFSRAWLLSQSGKHVPPDPPPIPSWQEEIMNVLPTLSQGAVDQAGHVFFVHRMQALTQVVGAVKSVADAAALTVDGSFGPVTEQALRGIQTSFGITADGVCGPHTWGALLTGAP